MIHEPDPVDDLLDAFDERLAEGDLEGARAALDEAAALAGPDDPEVRLCEADLALDLEGPEAAEARLRALVRDEPKYADAWYALATLLSDEGEDEEAIDCYLEVLRLDAKLDRELPPLDPRVLDRIEAVAREVIDQLPPELGRPLSEVPIVLEERPAAYLVREGFDPRSFGLFEGRTQGNHDAPVPTRIVLFTHCLVESFGEGPELDEEVEVTVLHEVGHFFNLDEDDVARLGLA